MSTTPLQAQLCVSLKERFNTLLRRSIPDPRPVVLMTCGIAGSGKSTLSTLITSAWPSFKRLSIDRYIYSQHGLYGRDYPEEMYEIYQQEARRALQKELVELLLLQQQQKTQTDVILDFAFPFREQRDEWKNVIEAAGGRWVLVAIQIDHAELRRRVAARNALVVKDGDSAFYITEEILERYIAGFEMPVGEGEVVVQWRDRLLVEVQ